MRWKLRTIRPAKKALLSLFVGQNVVPSSTQETPALPLLWAGCVSPHLSDPGFLGVCVQIRSQTPWPLPSDGCKRWGAVTSFWCNVGLKLCYRITTLLLLLSHKGANLFLTCYSIIKQHAELWTTLPQKCLRDNHAFSPCVICRMYFIVTCLRINNNEHSLLILFVSHEKRNK